MIALVVFTIILITVEYFSLLNELEIVISYYLKIRCDIQKHAYKSQISCMKTEDAGF